MNAPNLDKKEMRLVSRFFGRYLSDQKYDASILRSSSSPVYKFFMLNYHFLGFVKKILLFLILVALEGDFQSQIYAIYSVLGFWFLTGALLRPFKTPVLNLIRSVSDLTIVSYFLIIHFCDSLKRDLSSMSQE